MGKGREEEGSGGRGRIEPLHPSLGKAGDVCDYVLEVSAFLTINAADCAFFFQCGTDLHSFFSVCHGPVQFFFNMPWTGAVFYDIHHYIRLHANSALRRGPATADWLADRCRFADRRFVSNVVGDWRRIQQPLML